MKFENTQVMNFKNALRGMRNPKNSWDKSDSFFGLLNLNDIEQDYEVTKAWIQKNHPDMDLYGYEYDNKELDEEFDSINQWLIKNGILQTDFQKELYIKQKTNPNFGALSDNFENFKWQLQELRVALFAQELKTPTPISVKRLQKVLENIKYNNY